MKGLAAVAFQQRNTLREALGLSLCTASEIEHSEEVKTRVEVPDQQVDELVLGDSYGSYVLYTIVYDALFLLW